MMMKVFVSRNIPYIVDGLKARFHALGLAHVEVDFYEDSHRAIPREVFEQRVNGVDGMLVLLTDQVDRALLEEAGGNLKVVSSMSVGYDHIDVESCRNANVVIGNTPGVLDNAVSISSREHEDRLAHLML